MPQIIYIYIYIAVMNNVVTSRHICISYLQLTTYSSERNPVSSPGTMYLRNTKLKILMFLRTVS
jgi:hypothetical protein